MPLPKLLITYKFELEKLPPLTDLFDIDIYPPRLNNEKSMENFKYLLGSTDILLSMLSFPITKEILDCAPNLKLIAQYAVGYNNIDIKECKRRGIKVTNTPDVLTNATADLTWALILSLSRRIIEADKVARTKKWGFAPDFMLGTEITGSTLGIIGMGRIGLAVAKRAIGFDMKILYHNRNRRLDEEKKYGLIYVSLEELLKQSDIISIHCPYTSETHHLIGEKELKMMKKTALLINTSRGKVINEPMLVKAMEEGWIKKAGLDVFYDEPNIPDSLVSSKKVILTPHIGSATEKTRNNMLEMVKENIIAFKENKDLPNLINELRV